MCVGEVIQNTFMYILYIRISKGTVIVPGSMGRFPYFIMNEKGYLKHIFILEILTLNMSLLYYIYS